MLQHNLIKHLTNPENYYWIDRASTDVLLCLGESWTQGHGLGARQYSDVFGAVLSKQLNCDWINGSCNGGSNSWMLNNFEMLLDFLNHSNYQQGTVILTFTEHGRDIRDYQSRPFDYISAYNTVPHNVEFYNLVLDDVEQQWIQRLDVLRQKLHARFRIVVGCNFVWHNYLAEFCQSHPRITWVNQSWLELLAQDCNKVPPPRVRLTNIESLSTVNSILAISDSQMYKKWFIENSHDSSEVVNWMRNTLDFFESHDPGHPNARGHMIWSNTIKNLLTF